MHYLTTLSVSLLLSFSTLAETQLNDIVSSKKQVQANARNLQESIVKIDDKTATVVNEYRGLLRENKVLSAYNAQLEKQIDQQNVQLDRLALNMAKVRETRMELMPHMEEMIAVLDQFIAQDMPFLWQERQLRLQALKGLLDNPNVAVADKYRRILEAYQIETEYGDTIETWQAQLPFVDAEKTVQLVRVGRVGLYYLTPDHQQAGYWDNNQRSWADLPDSWLSNIKQIHSVAESKTLPSLLEMPLLPSLLVDQSSTGEPIVRQSSVSQSPTSQSSAKEAL